MGKERVGKLEDYVLFKAKPSGAREGGVYKLKPELGKQGGDGTLFFIKRMDREETVNEYIGSNIARVLLGESAPEVQLLKDNQGQVYAASRAIENFKTASDYLQDAGLPLTCWPHGCIIDESGNILPVQSYMLGWVQTHQPYVHIFEDSEKVQLTAKFLEHSDMHTQNLGVRGKGDKLIAAVIDFSLSFIDGIHSSQYYLPTGSNNKVLTTLEIILEKKAEVLALLDELLADVDKAYGSTNEKDKVQIKDLYLRKFSAIEREVDIFHLIRAIDTGHKGSIEKFSNKITDAAFFKDVNDYAIDNLIASVINTKNKPLIEKALSCIPPIRMKKVFIDAITNKDIDKFEIIFDYIKSKPEAMEAALVMAQEKGREDMFNKVLPYVGVRSNAISLAFVESVETNDADKFNKILEQIKSEPSAMKLAFAKTVEINDTEKFNGIFELIKSRPEALEEALKSAVKNNREAMLYKMLPHLNPYSPTLGEIFNKAIELSDADKFNKILDHIKSKPEALEEALKAAVKNNREAMLYKMLPHVYKYSVTLGEIFNKAVAENDAEKFYKLLPYMDPKSRAMESALAKAIEINDADKFDKIFEHIKSEPSAMKLAFAKAVEINDADRFNRILDHIKSKPDALEEALKAAVKNNREAMLYKMLPHLNPDSSTLGEIFIKAIELNDADKFDKIFEHIKSKPSAMETAFIIAAENNNEAVIDKMLPYMEANSPAVGSVLVMAARINDINKFNKILKYIMPSPDAMKRALYGLIFEKDKTAFCKQILMNTNDISIMSSLNAKIIMLAKEDGKLFVNMLEKAKVNSPKLVEGLMAVLPDMLTNSVVKQQLIVSGNKDILDRIREAEGVNIHIASAPESTSVSSSNVPSLPTPGQQASQLGSMPPFPESHGTLTLVAVVAAKVTGAKISSTPVPVETPPVFKGYVEQENTTDGLPPPSTVLKDTERSSHSVTQEWLQETLPTPNKGPEDDEMPPLEDVVPVTHAKDQYKTPKPTKKDPLSKATHEDLRR